MIGIQLDGRRDYLETKPGTTINITIENPILGDNTEKLSPGSFSLPFDLPSGKNSERNSAALKNPDVVESKRYYQVQKASLSYGGNLFKKGRIKWKSFKDGNTSAYFTFGLSTIGDKFKTAKLRDIINEEKVISSAPIDKLIYIKVIGPDSVTVEINGISYTATTTAELDTAINNYFYTNIVVGAENVWLPSSERITSGSSPLGMASDYLEVRLSRLADTAPFLRHSTDPHNELNLKLSEENRPKVQVEGFDMTSYYAAFQTFIDAQHQGSELYFPVRFNANLHGGDTRKDSEIINGVDAGGIIKNNANWGAQNNEPLAIRNNNSIQPFLYIKHVLDTIGAAFEFEYEGDFYDDPVTASRIQDNSQTLDLLLSYLGTTKFIFWRRSFNTSELVPDITVVDFFKSIAGRYNLAVHYNEHTGKVRMQYREPIAKSSNYHDITSYASIKKEMTDMRITGLRLKVSKEDTDEFSKEETITIGTPEKDIPITCGRLHREKTAFINGGTVKGIYVSQKNAQKSGMRVFMKVGPIDNGAYTYPAAHISLDDGTNYEGLEDFNLVAGGIYTRYWKYWLHFEMNRMSISIDAQFDFRQLKRFDYELKRRYDRTNYLVKSMKVVLTNRKMKVTEVELYTMR